MRSERLNSYYIYNRNNKQMVDNNKNETKSTRKQRNYEDMLFDEVV